MGRKGSGENVHKPAVVQLWGVHPEARVGPRICDLAQEVAHGGESSSGGA